MEHMQWMDTSFCPQCNSAMSSLSENSWPCWPLMGMAGSADGIRNAECSLPACHPVQWLPRMSQSITWLFWRADGASCLPHLSLMRRIWSLVKQPRAAWRNAKMAVKGRYEGELPLSLYIFHWSLTKMLLCILNNKKSHGTFLKFCYWSYTKYINIYRIVSKSLSFDLDFKVLISYFTVSN